MEKMEGKAGSQIKKLFTRKLILKLTVENRRFY